MRPTGRFRFLTRERKKALNQTVKVSTAPKVRYGVYREIVATVEIFATRGQDDCPLRDEGFEAVLGAPGIAVIDETGRKPPGEVEQVVGLAQQQDATVGGQPAAVEKADDTASFKAGYGKPEQAMR